MSSRADGYSATIWVFAFLTHADEVFYILEFAGSICIGEHSVLASNMTHAVCDCSAFAPVLLKCNHAD
jgi:hypothetical protein